MNDHPNVVALAQELLRLQRQCGLLSISATMLVQHGDDRITLTVAGDPPLVTLENAVGASIVPMPVLS